MNTSASDIWTYVDRPGNLVLVTTNNVIKSNGSLVMGKGIAREACIKFPGIDKVFGNMVRTIGEEYGILIADPYAALPIGALQTKYGWMYPSPAALVVSSLYKLRAWMAKHKEVVVHIPLPGSGLGGISVPEATSLVEGAFSEEYSDLLLVVHIRPHKEIYV